MGCRAWLLNTDGISRRGFVNTLRRSTPLPARSQARQSSTAPSRGAALAPGAPLPSTTSTWRRKRWTRMARRARIPEPPRRSVPLVRACETAASSAPAPPGATRAIAADRGQPDRVRGVRTAVRQDEGGCRERPLELAPRPRGRPPRLAGRDALRTRRLEQPRAEPHPLGACSLARSRIASALS